MAEVKEKGESVMALLKLGVADLHHALVQVQVSR
jgi:hypothetical protein